MAKAVISIGWRILEGILCALVGGAVAWCGNNAFVSNRQNLAEVRITGIEKDVEKLETARDLHGAMLNSKYDIMMAKLDDINVKVEKLITRMDERDRRDGIAEYVPEHPFKGTWVVGSPDCSQGM